MPISNTDIYTLAKDIWELVLKQELLCEPPASINPEQMLVCAVHFAGQQQGAVVLELSKNTARHAASIMLTIPLESVVLADMRDALQELTNMIGSHVRTLLVEGSKLGIPAMVADVQEMARTFKYKMTHQVLLQSSQEPVKITVYVAVEKN
jgi:CheY-specific phosphatase CheX